MNKITRFVITDIVRNKIMIGYTILLAVLSWSVFSMEDNVSKGMLTLLNLILLNGPLVAIIFSTIYLYNSSEFIELMLSQPVKRSRIWYSLFSGLQLAMFLAFAIGAGIPILIFSPDALGVTLVLVGSLVNAIFVALAFLGSIISRDKAKGIGMAILLWLFFALLFDGLVLFILFQFSDYPIEKFMVFMSALSPIDLSRILVLLQMDVSAMMGYTGAIFREFFGSTFGMSICFALLLIWVALPFYISLRKFNRKDL